MLTSDGTGDASVTVEIFRRVSFIEISPAGFTTSSTYRHEVINHILCHRSDRLQRLPTPSTPAIKW